MIGTTLKNLLDEREIKVNEFARQIKVPAQTLYSIIRRDNMKIDFELLLRICDALHVPLETFCGTGSTGQPTPEEWETLWKLRRLDDHGRFVTLQLLDAECARLQAAQRQPERNKVIPLYMTPAAAGYASPALGDDYEDYEEREAVSKADKKVSKDRPGLFAPMTLREVTVSNRIWLQPMCTNSSFARDGRPKQFFF